MYEILLSKAATDKGQNSSHLKALMSKLDSSNADHLVIEDGVISLFENKDVSASLMLKLRDHSIEYDRLTTTSSNNISDAGAQLTNSLSIDLLGAKIRINDLRQLLSILLNSGLSLLEVSISRGTANHATGLRLHCSGKQAVEGMLSSELAKLSQASELDINICPNLTASGAYQLACFDMDSTLIQVEVIDELAKHAGVGEQVATITESAMRGEIDFGQSFVKRMALLKGLNEQTTALIAEQLPLTKGVERLMRNLKRQGIRTAILSGGFDYFANHLKQMLDFDYVYANRLEVRDSQLTGRAIEPIVDAEFKKNSLIQIADDLGIPLNQVVAVGDGANDLKMMATAGLGIAFDAKPLVKQSAQCSISYNGLDSALYLMGYSDRDLVG